MTMKTDGLRARREAAGLSREKLARLADCSASTIAAYENGYKASRAMAQRLADALGVEVSNLFDEGNR